ncbi:transposase [Microtetraspora malaysiensis]|uniref:Transposase n=1 Tax=Microtetraspora malaysiensis TaxID=161358 RepID=A0ABW6T302_9ACTN
MESRDSGVRVAGDPATTLLFARTPPVRYVFADAGFAGTLTDWTQRILRTVLHIVRKAPGQIGFAVIERRWVVERSLAWLTSHRRLARDYERQPAMAEAMVRWAAISGMARRLTRGSAATRQQRFTLAHPSE